MGIGDGVLRLPSPAAFGRGEVAARPVPPVERRTEADPSIDARLAQARGARVDAEQAQAREAQARTASTQADGTAAPLSGIGAPAGAAGFLATQIAQAYLGTGLHHEPIEQGINAYTSADRLGARAEAGEANRRGLKLDV